MGAQKLRKVILTVSPRGISLQDAETQETIENISIYRCAAPRRAGARPGPTHGDAGGCVGSVPRWVCRALTRAGIPAPGFHAPGPGPVPLLAQGREAACRRGELEGPGPHSLSRPSGWRLRGHVAPGAWV